jgi:hypothetical protein
MREWFKIHKPLNVIQHCSRRKTKQYDHLNSYRKSFDRIQHPFITKSLKKPEIAGMYFNQ